MIPTALGNWWWLLCSVFALPAAVIMLVKMVLNHPLDALLVARIVIVGSLVMFGLSPLNSGWTPWACLLASFGGFMAAVLLATGWCQRANQDEWLVPALWRYVIRSIRSAFTHTKEAARDW